jgi:hypothetical protein
VIGPSCRLGLDLRDCNSKPCCVARELLRVRIARPHLILEARVPS